MVSMVDLLVCVVHAVVNRRRAMVKWTACHWCGNSSLCMTAAGAYPAQDTDTPACLLVHHDFSQSVVFPIRELPARILPEKEG